MSHVPTRVVFAIALFVIVDSDTRAATLDYNTSSIDLVYQGERDVAFDASKNFAVDYAVIAADDPNAAGLLANVNWSGATPTLTGRNLFLYDLDTLSGSLTSEVFDFVAPFEATGYFAGELTPGGATSTLADNAALTPQADDTLGLSATATEGIAYRDGNSDGFGETILVGLGPVGGGIIHSDLRYTTLNGTYTDSGFTTTANGSYTSLVTTGNGGHAEDDCIDEEQFTKEFTEYFEQQASIKLQIIHEVVIHNGNTIFDRSILIVEADDGMTYQRVMEFGSFTAVYSYTTGDEDPKGYVESIPTPAAGVVGWVGLLTLAAMRRRPTNAR